MTILDKFWALQIGIIYFPCSFQPSVLEGYFRSKPRRGARGAKRLVSGFYFLQLVWPADFCMEVPCEVKGVESLASTSFAGLVLILSLVP
ncbi:hypothetical protein R1flu_005235 [Riccia fluitans]|uniref:Uncharacterized protein n=1 Tax=Riccia fluitans TaxID=41844 RepID=A0ABD1YT42_9MARC